MLIDAVRKIKGATDAELASAEFLAEQVREVGLFGDRRAGALYGDETPHMKRQPGTTWQKPRELAEAMLWLWGKQIGSYLEVGVFRGGTFGLMVAYLSRHNPSLRAVGIDLVDRDGDVPRFELFSALEREYPGLEYRVCTSDSLRGHGFDFCFIDGNHRYHGVGLDFDNVGQYARLCMFHDINCRWQPGVRAFWREISQRYDGVEFCRPPADAMGIGILTVNNPRDLPGLVMVSHEVGASGAVAARLQRPDGAALPEVGVEPDESVTLRGHFQFSETSEATVHEIGEAFVEVILPREPEGRLLFDPLNLIRRQRSGA